MPLDKSTYARQAVIVLFIGIAVCMASSLIMMPYLPDDSYISFRYAEHLAKGFGITFNPGEQPVEGYSNFLWIVFIAMLHKFGFDLPTFVPYVGAVIACLNVLVLWLILRRRELPPLQMLLPLVLLGGSGPFITYTISGLEAPLYALLLLLTVFWMDAVFVLGRTRDYVWMALSASLLSITRPEGIVALPVIIAAMIALPYRRAEDTAYYRSRTKNLLIAGAVFVLFGAIYHTWRIHYFGEVIPTPFLSKGGAGKSLWYAWKKNIAIYFAIQGDYFPPMGYYFTTLLALAIVGYRQSISALAHKRTELVAIILCVVYNFVYFNFKDWMPAMRYHSVLVGVFLIPAAHVQGPFFARIEKMTRQMKLQYTLVAIAVVMMSYSVFAQLKIITSQAEFSNQTCLVELGKWLREIMPPGSTLAISDVGAIPYYSGFRTIDIHPESLTDLYIAKNGFDIEYFYRVKPDIVILPSRSIFVTRFYPEHYAMAEDKRFQNTYRFLGASRYDWFQDRSYWVFIPGPYPKISKEVMDRFPHGVGTISRKRD